MSYLNRTVLIRAVVVALFAVAAIGAGPVGIASAEPVPFKTLGVSLLVQSLGSSAPLLLVSAVLPDDVALPAEVALPVPPGAQVQWAGEIIGQTVEEDIETEAVIEEGEFGSVAVFTLTSSRIAQVEVTYPGAVASAQGGASMGAFSLAASVSAESARLAIALPPGGTVTEIPEGVLVSPGPDGYTYYYTDVAEVSAGDPLELGLGFALSAAPQPSAPAMSAPSAEVPPLLIVIIAAVLGGALLMLLASRARRSSAVVDEEYDVTDVVSQDVLMAEGEEIPAQGEPAPDVPGMAEATVAADAGGAASSPAPAPAPPFLAPRVLVIIAAVLVLGVVLVINLTGESSQVGVIGISDGWITQRISSADAAQQVDYQLRIACDCPPEAEAPKIFAALATVPGVATASLQQTTLVLSVGYDPALTNEAAIATVLQSKGYLP